jgi:drug/metabolite transporter (DMT)-like permease
MALGALLAVLSAAAFALNGATVRRGVLTASVAQGMAITVPFGVPLFFFAALFTGYLGMVTEFSTFSVILLCAAGILHFVWGRYCNYRAIKAMGSNAGIPFRALDFPLKLALAIIFLGEVLTPLKIFGIGLILAGGAIAMKKPAKNAAKEDPDPRPESVGAAAVETAPVFVPNYAEGYTYILLSVTGYGLSPLFIRAALEDAGVGAGLAGGLISYLAATAIIALAFLKPGQFDHVFDIDRKATKWFLVSALFVALSHMFRYMALAVAPITVVAPVQRAAGLLKVVFNWLINRDHEVFEPRLLAGIGVSILGAVTVTLTTDFVINLVPLPDFVIRMVDSTWP